VNGNVHLDYLERPASHWLEVACSKGSIHWNALNGSIRIQRSSSQPEQEIQPPIGFERNDLFLSQMKHFIEVVRGSTSPRCTLDDGIKALQIALAVHASERGNKQIVL
jgi:predicted dehydrogenase